MKNTKTKFHRDGTVSVWNVYEQQWQRMSATRLCQSSGPNPLLPTLPMADRRRIERIAERGGMR